MHTVFFHWHIDPISMGFALLLCAVYLYAVNFRVGKQGIFFFSAVLFLPLSVSLPFGFAGEKDMFSRHMAVHVLLLLIIAPLIAISIPAENRLRAFLLSCSQKMAHAPFLSWFTGVGIMWFWHIPFIFNHVQMMDQQMGAGVFMYINMFSLLIAGLIFSWPIVNPYRQYRVSPPLAVLYFSAACVFCSLLGLLITFAPVGTYAHYMTANAMEHRFFGINKSMPFEEADLQTGGLIMWVPCCIVYLSASMYLLIQWFNDKKESSSIIA